MALSDLFPYGAPELVEGAEPRMSRSLLGAAVLVTSVLVLGGMLVGRAVALAAVAPSEEVEERTIVLDPPPSSEAGRSASGYRDPESITAVPVPVNDPAATPGLVLTDPALPEAPMSDRAIGIEEPGARSDVGSGNGPGAWRESEEVLPPGAYVDLMPELLSGDAPRYPDLARESGTEGRIRVLMRVGTDGRVREARIAPGPSIAALEDAALEAARSCRFVPARSNGRLVSVWVARTYEFRLH